MITPSETNFIVIFLQHQGNDRWVRLFNLINIDVSLAIKLELLKSQSCVQCSCTLQPRARLPDIPNYFNYMVYYHDDQSRVQTRKNKNKIFRIRFCNTTKTQIFENDLSPMQNKKHSKWYSSNYLNYLLSFRFRSNLFFSPQDIFFFPPRY